MFHFENSKNNNVRPPRLPRHWFLPMLAEGLMAGTLPVSLSSFTPSIAFFLSSVSELDSVDAQCLLAAGTALQQLLHVQNLPNALPFQFCYKTLCL